MFYDPVKERRMERNKEIARELGVNQDDLYVSKIKPGSFRAHMRTANKAKSSQNIRLVVIIIVLLFLAYMLLYR